MKGINVNQLKPTSDFDYEFGAMVSHRIRFVRVQIKYFITGSVDTVSVLEMLASAHKHGIKVILAMPNREHWPNTAIYTTDQICSFWVQLLSIGDHPSVVAYELCNEPQVEWPELQDELYSLIRKHTDKFIVVTSPNVKWSFDEPLPYVNVMYSYHDYENFKYTHQGIHDFELRPDLVYPGMSEWSNLLSNTIAWDDKYSHFQPIRDFQVKYNVPIFIGEFSCTNDANGGDEWVRDSMNLFNNYGWSWFYHCWATQDSTFDKWHPKENRMNILQSGL